MTTTQNQAVLEQGRADQRELSAQLKRHVYQLLEQTPAVVAGEPVPWKLAPHIVVDVLDDIVAEVWEALVAYDAATELPAAKRQIDRRRVRLGILEAMASPMPRSADGGTCSHVERSPIARRLALFTGGDPPAWEDESRDASFSPLFQVSRSRDDLKAALQASERASPIVVACRPRGAQLVGR